MKAIATKPEDRYPTCRALAEDVERWVADEPVAARREPYAERARRWMQHHRPLVAGAGSLVLATVAGLAVRAVLLGRANARTERRRQEAVASSRAVGAAHYELALAAVERYFTRVSEDRLLNEPHMEGLRKDLLETAGEFYRRLHRRT